ncbi:MAG: hypothetical protein M1816_000804 [Peltula sp. TS41687]|nr:MAG: hypothetical protein M1816_000804 [Peltula sp. TS41687]
MLNEHRHGSLRTTATVSILFLSSVCPAATPNVFLEPQRPGDAGDYSDNNLYQTGTVAHVSWRTTYTNITLRLHNEANGTFVDLLSGGVIFDDIPNPSRLDWTVNTRHNLSVQRVFYFEVIDESRRNTGDTFNSHYFNLTNDHAEPTTTASSSTPSPTATSELIESGPAATTTGSRQSASAIGGPTPTGSSNNDDSVHRYTVGLGTTSEARPTIVTLVFHVEVAPRQPYRAGVRWEKEGLQCSDYPKVFK